MDRKFLTVDAIDFENMPVSLDPEMISGIGRGTRPQDADPLDSHYDEEVYTLLYVFDGGCFAVIDPHIEMVQVWRNARTNNILLEND